MKKLFTVLNLIFIFLIVNFLVSGLYGYFTRELENDAYARVSESQPTIIEKKKYQNQSYYTSVVTRDLFVTKKQNSLSKKQPEKGETAPDKEVKLTELKLELKGTITGTGSEPIAVIRKPGDKKEMMYTEGDTVDRARIKRILRQRVVLLVDGREETLLMEKIKKSKNSGKTTHKTAAGIFQRSDAEPTVDQIVLTINDVETLTSDVQTAKKQVRIRPHFYKGKMDGFRVTGLRRSSVFYQKLGLRNGDIISAVNDQEIEKPHDVSRFYDVFTRLDDYDVTDVLIKRNGLPKTIRYSIE